MLLLGSVIHFKSVKTLQLSWQAESQQFLPFMTNCPWPSQYKPLSPIFWLKGSIIFYKTPSNKNTEVLFSRSRRHNETTKIPMDLNVCSFWLMKIWKTKFFSHKLSVKGQNGNWDFWSSRSSNSKSFTERILAPWMCKLLVLGSLRFLIRFMLAKFNVCQWTGFVRGSFVPRRNTHYKNKRCMHYHYFEALWEWCTATPKKKGNAMIFIANPVILAPWKKNRLNPNNEPAFTTSEY